MLSTFHMSIVLGILTFVLILVSLFLILIVLAQKAKSDGGVGAALGGGMTEAAFGADTGNVLSGLTIKAAVAFFVLSFGLYLGHIYQRKHGTVAQDALPSIAAPAAAPVTATPAPATAPATTTVPVEGTAPKAP
jgi:preprotein translocase subunit SecG